jgi:hypothetical protein
MRCIPSVLLLLHRGFFEQRSLTSSPDVPAVRQKQKYCAKKQPVKRGGVEAAWCFKNIKYSALMSKDRLGRRVEKESIGVISHQTTEL